MINLIYVSKDKLCTENNYSLQCDNNQILVDMRSYMHPMTTQLTRIGILKYKDIIYLLLLRYR
jgi:hypothetical protein